MFTGIITDIGEVVSLEGHHDKIFTIKTSYDTSIIELGDSVACSGACLTVIEKKENLLKFEASQETLTKTTLNEWSVGSKINMEKALTVGQHLGGHIVSGHVDGVATVKEIKNDGQCKILTIFPPKEYMIYLAPKGSVVIDGISLTINNVYEESFDITIISHTQENTIIKYYQSDQRVNFEVDSMARYIVHFMKHMKEK